MRADLFQKALNRWLSTSVRKFSTELALPTDQQTQDCLSPVYRPQSDTQLRQHHDQ